MPHKRIKKAVHKFSSKIGKPIDKVGFAIGKVELRGLTGQTKRGISEQIKRTKEVTSKAAQIRRSKGLGKMTGARGFLNRLFK